MTVPPPGGGHVRRAGERFRTEQPGIRTWHVFSAGAHYDPSHLSFGPVIGCDEHLVEPGAGFDWHAHRGVVIVSWVLHGVLRHEDADGREVHVPAGRVLVQSTGDGIRHRETNGADVALRFVQTTLLVELGIVVATPDLPTRCGEVTVDVEDGADGLAPGDSVRAAGSFAVAAADARLVVRW